MFWTPLSFEAVASLELRHKRERDRRIVDRIRAVLFRNEGWTLDEIAKALRISPETARQHLEDYKREEKLAPASGGSESRLNDPLDETLYATAAQVAQYTLVPR
jgi:transposase